MDTTRPSLRRSIAGYYRTLTRSLAAPGYLPADEREVGPWSLARAIHLWNRVCRVEGDTFAEYLRRSGVNLPLRLLSRRELAIVAVYAWPWVAAAITWKHRGHRLEQWSRAIARPDLYAAFPAMAFSPEAVAERRSDMYLAIANGWDYAASRSPDYAIEDKRVFAERAAAAGLPVVTELAHDVALASDGPFIVKDPGKDMGVGVRRVETTRELRALLVPHPELLVQRALANHPALAPLLPAQAPLCTLRLLTTRVGSARPLCHVGYFRIGAASSAVDNLSRGGTLVELDLRDGTLLRGVSYPMLQGREPVGQGIDRAAGALRSFVGERLPHFGVAVALVERAHAEVAPSLLSIGWDVALTPDGPLLVEANVFAGSYEMTRFHGSFAIGAQAILARLRARHGA